MGLTLALAITGLVQDPKLDQKIDYETRGKDVVHIVRELSEQNGLKLATSGLKNWPLILSLRGRPMKDVMSLVASLTDSEWIRSDDRYTLTRTPARVRETARAEAKERGDRMKAWLAANRKTEQPLRAWTDDEVAEVARASEQKARQLAARHAKDYKFSSTGEGDAPASIILIDFLRRISAEALGSLPVHGQVVYSTAPTKGEIQMPVDLNPALNAFRETRRKLKALVPGEFYSFEGVEIRTPATRSALTEAGPITVKVTLGRQEAYSGVAAKVDVYAGRLIDTYNMLVEIQSSPRPEMEDVSGPIELSPDSVALLKAAQRPQRTSAVGDLPLVGTVFFYSHYMPPPPAKVQEIVRDPAGREPMSYFVADWLMASAKALKAELAATLPDVLAAPIAVSLRGSTRLETIWKTRAADKLSSKLENGLLTIRPTSMAMMDQYRVDRAALGNLFRTFTSDRLPTIDEKALYGLVQPPVYADNSLDFLWMSILDPERIAFERSNAAFLRLWAALNPGDKAKKPVELLTERMSQVQFSLLRSFFESYATAGGWGNGDSASSSPLRDPEPREPDPVSDVYRILRNPSNRFLVDFIDGSQARLSEDQVGYRIGFLSRNLPVTLVKIKSFRAIEAEGFSVHIPPVRTYGTSCTSNGSLGPIEYPDRLSAGMEKRLAEYIAQGKTMNVRFNSVLQGG